MAEAVEATSAAIDILDRLIQGCISAYGIYQLTEDFGKEFEKIKRAYQTEKGKLQVLETTRYRYLSSLDEADVQQDLLVMWESIFCCEKLMRDNGAGKKVSDQREHSRLRLLPGFLKLGSERRETTSRASAATRTRLATIEKLQQFEDEAKRLRDEAEAEAKRLQDSTGIMTRATWAFKEKKKFETAVEKIKEINVSLRGVYDRYQKVRFHIRPEDAILSQVPFLDPDPNLPVIFEHFETQAILTVKLSTERRPRSSLRSGPPLRNDASIYFVQVHTDEHQPDRSYFILAEGFPTPPSSNLAPIHKPFVQPLQNTQPTFQDVGTSLGSTTTVQLYQDATSAWAKRQTLQDLLGNDTYQQAFLPRAQLGLLVAYSFLQFACNFKGNVFPQAVDYFYYQRAGSAAAGPQPAGNPAIAREALTAPYLRFDLGYRQLAQQGPEDMVLGSGFHPDLEHENAIVALGILLCEVGAWKSVSGADPGELKSAATSALPEVSKRAGQIFANIARRCLCWQPLAIDTDLNRMKELETIVALLTEYEQGLRTRLRAIKPALELSPGTAVQSSS